MPSDTSGRSERVVNRSFCIHPLKVSVSNSTLPTCLLTALNLTANKHNTEMSQYGSTPVTPGEMAGREKKKKREKSDVEAKVNCPLLHNVIHLSHFKENYHPSCKPTPPRAPHHTNFFLSSINESPVDASGGINSIARRNNSSSFPAPKAGVFIRKAIHTADATKHQKIFWRHILEDTGSGPCNYTCCGWTRSYRAPGNNLRGGATILGGLVWI